MGTKELTYKEKVLLYLRDYKSLGEKKVYPRGITQKGIAEAVGMRRTHVSRVMRDLIENKEVEEYLGHVKGRSRKLKVYTLRPEGVARGDEIIKELESVYVQVSKEGRTFKSKLTELEELSGKRLSLLESIELVETSDQPIDLDESGSKRFVTELSKAPVVEELYGRNEVLTMMDEWMKKDIPVAVLEGRRGSGASCTARRFLDSVDDRHLLWVDVQDDDVIKKIDDFFFTVHDDKKKLFQALKETPALIVIDDYYNVEDELVDFFVEMVDRLDKEYQTKILVTTREGLPVYERFYHREHLKEGKVDQISIPPLNEEEAELILGKELESSALRRIMLMTKGSPQILKHLRDGRIDKIEGESALVREQVSLLMFLKEQTR
ncbi:MAG: hypothetical protein R6U17_01140 [Thermoplasmata archaeon]